MLLFDKFQVLVKKYEFCNIVLKKSGLTIKICVDAVLHVGAGSEVDQLQVQRPQVDEQVLVLDVPVDDSLAVAGDDGLDDLAEEVAGQLLLQLALLGDEIKQILARLRSLHDDDE